MGTLRKNDWRQKSPRVLWKTKGYPFVFSALSNSDDRSCPEGKYPIAQCDFRIQKWLDIEIGNGSSKLTSYYGDFEKKWLTSQKSESVVKTKGYPFAFSTLFNSGDRRCPEGKYPIVQCDFTIQKWLTPRQTTKVLKSHHTMGTLRKND